MAGIPQNFAAISNALPTYNFVDIAAGTGIINFYAGDTVDTDLLSNSTFYSDTVADSGNLPATNYGKVLDVDYDVLLNRPLDIAGKVVLNVPVGLISSTVSPSTGYCYVVKVYRLDLKEARY